MRRQARRSFVAVLMALLLALVAGAVIGGCRREAPVERGVAAGCYREEGGDKWVCQDGGEMEFQTGSTLDVQSGATAGFGGNLLVTGTLDVDGATTLNSTLDVDGNLSSGTGAVTVTDNVVVDGQADAVQLLVQGYTTQTSNLLTLEQSDGTDVATVSNAGALGIEGDLTFENDETLSNASDGTITATVASDGYFAVATGNLVVGDPSGASLTINGVDAYIEGNLEADGNTRLDGDVTLGVGDLTMSNGHIYKEFTDLTVSDGETITPTDEADIVALDTSGEVTITVAACTTDGHELTLIGDDGNTINIAATNLRTTDGNALAMDQYDVVKLICQDTEWLLMLESNNQ